MRLHYGKGKGGDCTGGQLVEWAERVAAWSRERYVFVFFNNDRRGYAVRNAARLKGILAAQG